MGAQENDHDAVNGAINGLANEYDKDSNKGNEEKKIFCGGISYETTNEDLSSYFNQFGEVVQSQVKFDRITGRSRGFAFVEFATVEGCKLALNQREQLIKSKQCEIKPAKTRENNFSNKKVFVGGLPADFPEEDLRKHFEQFGMVEEVEWPFDKQTKARRNFAFIVFDEEDGADRAANTAKQIFGSRECDVKKAVPQSRRKMIPGGHIALRGAFGGPGIRGPSMTAVPTTPAQWFGAWPQLAGGVSVPYAAANATAAGAWGDWYGNQAVNAAAAANYYAQGGTNNAASYNSPYPSIGVPNGYDYSQAANISAVVSRQAHQNGGVSLNTAHRYPQPHPY